MLDKLILAQSTMKKVNFVSAEEMEPVQEGEDTQFAEVCYMSNRQRGPGLELRNHVLIGHELIDLLSPLCLDEESLQALFDEPLGRALKEGEDAASKARPGEKKKDPPAQAPSVKPSQLTMTLFPTKFENGKIEYKIRYKGRSRPFSRAKPW
ncbi:unnamed protein product [Microthlaspi erraticum]|uniref:Uncharacterized protein n=1 Tax=Microthlaspi erraticum TaxID=1685480 RepID=A0A6D2KXC8_9BRAS|nr:unnamed protein product [Microthlaspi erraticum]